MSKSKNQKTAGGFLYIFCAVLIAAILCIALVTLISSPSKETSKKAGETAGVTADSPADTSRADAEAAVSVSDTQSDTAATPSEDASAAPVQYCLPVSGNITKEYNPLLAVFSMTMNDFRAHTGIDIAAETGTPVCCFTDGKITDVYDDKFWGTCIEIEHDAGLCSVYRNLSPELPENIAPGCVVEAGAQIACVGESAKLEAADSSHLHFELTKDGTPQNPLDYLSFPESDPCAASD